VGYEGARNSAGARHGRGVGVVGEGDRYEGEWLYGMREGTGTVVYSNGNRYTGGWVGDRESGQGVLWDATGTVLFAGQWKDGCAVSVMSFFVLFFPMPYICCFYSLCFCGRICFVIFCV
jgi:hypothetical protein